IGCSFTRTSFGTAMPKGKKIAHATLDPYAINKDVPVDLAAVGDAGLTLDALLDEVKDRLKGKTRDRLASVTREITAHKEESMAIELKVMPVSTEKYRSTDISGNYADFAKALGGYGERVTEPGEIAAAIRRGIAQTREGKPALLEFITEKAVDVSRFG